MFTVQCSIVISQTVSAESLLLYHLRKVVHQLLHRNELARHILPNQFPALIEEEIVTVRDLVGAQSAVSTDDLRIWIRQERVLGVHGFLEFLLSRRQISG